MKATRTIIGIDRFNDCTILVFGKHPACHTCRVVGIERFDNGDVRVARILKGMRTQSHMHLDRGDRVVVLSGHVEGRLPNGWQKMPAEDVLKDVGAAVLWNHTA